MIDKIYTFDNVITKEEQFEIFNFVKTTNLEWKFEPNINSDYGSNGEKSFPANVLSKFRLRNDSITTLIDKIQSNVIEKLNLNFVENYRYKINWTQPLNFEYNPMDLLHIDNYVQHIAMVYYINDASGDTYIYDNTEGNNIEVYYKYSLNKIDYSKLKLIKKVNPKMGSVVVFNGGLHHHANYPTNGDRYIINFNFVAKEKSKSLL
jgi:hypothetical protein